VTRVPRGTFIGVCKDIRIFDCHEPAGADSVRELLAALPGVEMILTSSSRYSITVYKSPAWSWDEVEPAIVDALRPFDLRMIREPQ
jgi:hypothetical protein